MWLKNGILSHKLHDIDLGGGCSLLFWLSFWLSDSGPEKLYKEDVIIS